MIGPGGKNYFFRTDHAQFGFHTPVTALPLHCTDRTVLVQFRAGGLGNTGEPAAIGKRLKAPGTAVDHAAQGIRVNALMPGVIDTPMPARSLKRYDDPDAMRAYWKQRHPMGRIGQPEEVARAALFLASDDSSFVTGTLLFVDGGWTAH